MCCEWLKKLFRGKSKEEAKPEEGQTKTSEPESTPNQQ